MWFQADNNNKFFILTLKTIYANERTIQIGNSFLFRLWYANKSHTDAQKHLTEILRLMCMLNFTVHKAVLRTVFQESRSILMLSGQLIKSCESRWWNLINCLCFESVKTSFKLLSPQLNVTFASINNCAFVCICLTHMSVSACNRTLCVLLFY